MTDDTDNGWSTHRLDEIIDFNPKETLPKGTEAPYVEMAALPQNGRWHDAPVLRAVNSGSRFRDNDTLLARITPCLENGKTAQVRGLGPGVIGWGSTEFIVMRAKPEVVDADYVYLLARDPGFREYAIQQMTGTSGRQRVPTESIASFEVSLPPLGEQRWIAEVFGALDDRIESLARAERMLLDYGLVQLEVALESAEARSMRVDEIATFENRKRIPLSQMERDKRPGPYPYYGATGIFGYVDDYLFDGFRVLVGEDGSVIEDDGTPVLQLAHGKYWVNNHAHVLAGRAVPTEALWFLLRNLAVDPAVTGAVQPKLSMGRLAALEVLVPSEASPFFPVAKECIAQVLHRREQLRDMVEARDFLLPRLVSSELRVAAAEELVEAAT